MKSVNVRKKLNKSLGMIKIECKSCKNVFGLDTNFIEKTSELNMRYTCPYCAVIVKDINNVG
jgi:hypothetical protein